VVVSHYQRWSLSSISIGNCIDTINHIGNFVFYLVIYRSRKWFGGTFDSNILIDLIAFFYRFQNNFKFGAFVFSTLKEFLNFQNSPYPKMDVHLLQLSGSSAWNVKLPVSLFGSWNSQKEPKELVVTSKFWCFIIVVFNDNFHQNIWDDTSFIFFGKQFPYNKRFVLVDKWLGLDKTQFWHQYFL
jgi:hypothetical protein